MPSDPSKETESPNEKNWHYSSEEPESESFTAPKPAPPGTVKSGILRLPRRWLAGLAAAWLVAMATILGYMVLRSRQPKIDPLAELTVPVELQNLALKISASGTIKPVQSVNLSPKTAGRIERLLVEQGDIVQAGQIIAVMESNDVRSRLSQANAGVAQAQARLEQLQAGARPEEIQQAQSRLAQAQAQLAQVRSGPRPEEIEQGKARFAQAQAQLAQVRSGPRPEEIEQAQSRLAQAQAQLAQLRAGSRPEEIEQAKAQVEAAMAAAALAAEKLRRNEMLAAEGAISQDALDEVRTEDRRARASLDEAEQRLELLLKGSRREEIQRAEAQVREAQQALALLERGSREEEIQRTEAQVREAQQALALLERGSREEEIQRAEAQVREAQQALTLLEQGNRVEEIAQAEAQVAEAQGRLRGVEVELEDATVRAPFGGQVTQKYATEGAFVTPTTSASAAGSATSTSVVTLARGLEVVAKVPEADISKIKPAQKVEIVADAYREQVFSGRVRLVAPEAIKEQDVTLFEVRVDIFGGEQQLRSGMNADVTFLGEEISGALVVPAVAIVTDIEQGGQKGVLVPDDKNQPQFRPVTVGEIIGDKIRIINGVETGERVFIGLPPGQKLEDILKQDN
uniref:Efflux RND transporter periplasmic adaptor subunit n=1 Tax=Planktothricoides sp. SpSt-374 TaxID=2282167 RepID=A0A7C3VJE9_9CYAN